MSTSSNLYCFDGFENQNCGFEYKSLWMRLFLEDDDTLNHRNRRQQVKFQSLIDSKSSSLINGLSQVAFESSQNYCTLFCVVRANQHWIYFEKDIWSVLLETIGNIGYSHATAWRRQQFWGCEKHYVGCQSTAGTACQTPVNLCRKLSILIQQGYPNKKS